MPLDQAVCDAAVHAEGIEGQPVGKDAQAYRILDAATGLLESGYVKVADMCARQPWLDEDDVTIPVTPAAL